MSKRRNGCKEKVGKADSIKRCVSESPEEMVRTALKYAESGEYKEFRRKYPDPMVAIAHLVLDIAPDPKETAKEMRRANEEFCKEMAVKKKSGGRKCG